MGIYAAATVCMHLIRYFIARSRTLFRVVQVYAVYIQISRERRHANLGETMAGQGRAGQGREGKGREVKGREADMGKLQKTL